MTLAKRSSIAVTAALVVMALCLSLFTAYGQAFASSNSSLTAGQTPTTTTTSKGSKTDIAKKQEKIAKAAAKISYSRAVYQGQGQGTKAYLSTCKKRLGSYYTSNSKQMQCNVPVAAAVRASGIDKKFPTTNDGMYNYMKKSKQWKCLGNYKTSVTSLKPGDVLIRIKYKTAYTKNGAWLWATTNHACVYVGKKIAKSVYKKNLKGTDADVGAPGSKRVFVSAHRSYNNASKRSAACLETAKQAYADCKMLVFRYVG